MSRSKTSGKRCLGEVFFGHAEDPLSFVFLCRSEEWLQAKGIMRKRRRRGGAEPAEDLELSPPPKSEPVEEVAPGRDIVVGNEPADQGEGRTHPVLWPTEQEQKPTPVGAVTPLERPRKLPRHSERSTFASSIVTGAPKKDSPGPKVKVERDSLLPTVKAERDGLSSTVKVERDSLLPTVKVEEVSSVPKVKEEAAEVMVNEPKVLKVRVCLMQILFFPLMCGKGYEQDLQAQKESQGQDRERMNEGTNNTSSHQPHELAACVDIICCLYRSI